MIEAKQTAKPSIIFPSGGLPELVTHGIDGYVCHDRSAAALERAFAFYESSPAIARAQGTAANLSLGRLAGTATFAEQWTAVFDGTDPMAGAGAHPGTDLFPSVRERRKDQG